MEISFTMVTLLATKRKKNKKDEQQIIYPYNVRQHHKIQFFYNMYDYQEYAARLHKAWYLKFDKKKYEHSKAWGYLHFFKGNRKCIFAFRNKLAVFQHVP
jgi:hypothetical protein